MQTFEVKVDGEIEVVTLAELIRAYQISGSAEKRLQEVTELRRELVARLRDLEKAPDRA